MEARTARLYCPVLSIKCSMKANICTIITNEMDQIESNRQSLFGSRIQTSVLMIVGLLGETYPRELSRLANASVSTVCKYLDRLEAQGVTVSRYIGKERRVSLNPRFVAYKQLSELIERLTLAEPEIKEAVNSVRRRPRRRGKAI